MKRVLQYQILLYVLEIIRSQLIICQYNDSLSNNFEIKKTHKLIVRKYYKLILLQNVKFYVKAYNIYLDSKIVRYKPYRNL